MCSFVFFFFKQKTAYEIGVRLVGSEMCIRDRADAVLGFDSYKDMSSHLTSILAGNRPASHVPSDRRRLLPLSPASRQASTAGAALPGHGGTIDRPGPASGPRVVRARLDGRPWAPLKIASGCALSLIPI